VNGALEVIVDDDNTATKARQFGWVIRAFAFQSFAFLGGSHGRQSLALFFGDSIAHTLHGPYNLLLCL